METRDCWPCALLQLLEAGDLGRLAADAAKLKQAVQYAAATGALTCAKPGGWLVLQVRPACSSYRAGGAGGARDVWWRGPWRSLGGCIRPRGRGVAGGCARTHEPCTRPPLPSRHDGWLRTVDGLLASPGSALGAGWLLQGPSVVSPRTKKWTGWWQHPECELSAPAQFRRGRSWCAHEPVSWWAMSGRSASACLPTSGGGAAAAVHLHVPPCTLVSQKLPFPPIYTLHTRCGMSALHYPRSLPHPMYLPLGALPAAAWRRQRALQGAADLLHHPPYPGAAGGCLA